MINKSLSSKQNSGNALANLYRCSEELVSKMNFFNPKESDRENPYYLRKHDLSDSSKDKSEIASKILPFINEKMIDRNKNIERIENLNNEIILERKRKKLIEKNREIKTEKMNLIHALNSLYKEIRDLNVDCEFLENFDRLMDTEEKLKRMFEDDSSKFNNNKKKKIQFKNLSERDALLSEMRNASWKRDEEFKQKKEEIENKLKTYSNLKLKIQGLDKEINKINEETAKITNKLLFHYHSILSEGKDTRKEGIVWIIKAIWNLSSNVIISFLPNFLDEKCIKFIFKYAQKDIELEKFREEIEEIKYNIKLYYQSHIDEIKRFSFKTEEGKEIFSRYKRRTSKAFQRIEKYTENLQNNYDDLNVKKVKEILDKTHNEPQSKIYIKKIKELEAKLEEKRIELKQLQQNELERLTREFLVNDYGRRFNVDQHTLISAIIGQDYASSEYSKNLREQKEFFQKINMCRTFNFITPTKTIPKRNINPLIPQYEQLGISYENNFYTID